MENYGAKDIAHYFLKYRLQHCGFLHGVWQGRGRKRDDDGDSGNGFWKVNEVWHELGDGVDVFCGNCLFSSAGMAACGEKGKQN